MRIRRRAVVRVLRSVTRRWMKHRWTPGRDVPRGRWINPSCFRFRASPSICVCATQPPPALPARRRRLQRRPTAVTAATTAAATTAVTTAAATTIAAAAAATATTAAAVIKSTFSIPVDVPEAPEFHLPESRIVRSVYLIRTLRQPVRHGRRLPFPDRREPPAEGPWNRRRRWTRHPIPNALPARRRGRRYRRWACLSPSS